MIELINIIFSNLIFIQRRSIMKNLILKVRYIIRIRINHRKNYGSSILLSSSSHLSSLINLFIFSFYLKYF